LNLKLQNNVVFIRSHILRNVHHGFSVNYESIIWELHDNISFLFELMLVWTWSTKQCSFHLLPHFKECSLGLMRITSSYFRELHKNISYSNLLLVWTWEHNIMKFSFGPTFWVMFTKGYLVWTMSSFFGNFIRTFSYLKFCWFELKTTKTMEFSLGPAFWGMFTMWLVWIISSLFGNFGRTFPFVFLFWRGGGGEQMENNPLQKGQEQKNNNKIQTFPIIVSLF